MSNDLLGSIGQGEVLEFMAICGHLSYAHLKLHLNPFGAQAFIDWRTPRGPLCLKSDI